MLELYDHWASVCAIKVRLVLAEKGLDWTDHFVDLHHGGQFDPASLVHVDRPFKVRAIGVDETAGAYRFSGIPRHMAMLNGVNSIKTR